MISGHESGVVDSARSRRSSLGLIVLFFLLMSSTQLAAAPAANLWSFWNKSDEQSSQQLQHGEWSGILQRHIIHDEQGRALVDYAALKVDDATVLQRYITSLAVIDPRTLRKPEQMAYWINLYNALTVQLVIEAYPVSSIRKIKGGFFSTGPWDEPVITVVGKSLTLNDIEHRILRPIWHDKRIHYAVNCASMGCPDLAATAYEADKLDAQLDSAARIFINQRKGLESLGEGRVQLSSIYDWYEVDFGSAAELFEHLQTFHEGHILVDGQPPAEIDYDYDWSLNDVRSR